MAHEGMKAPPGSLAFLHCLEVNKGAFPKVQHFANFYSWPSTFILNPRWLQSPPAPLAGVAVYFEDTFHDLIFKIIIQF